MKMKILYGVQGTGNGHMTRARMMAKEFKRLRVTVDFLFSGRDSAYFDMQPFGDYRTCSGLSFIAHNGKVDYLKTLKRNNLKSFYEDVKSLNVEDYDLVLSDFEPVTAWAAKIRKIPSVGLSHQNAFRYNIPVCGNNPVSHAVLKWFAPAQQNLGLHWHHFDQSLLPPMINTTIKLETPNLKKVLVYLPFMEIDRYHDLFHRFPDTQFIQYHASNIILKRGNITCNPLSTESFQQDFMDAGSIICNAGFGTCSEAIHYGKKLLVIPLQGQMEQLSNAAALEQLRYANAVVKDRIKSRVLAKWLAQPMPQPIEFPNVAREVAHWILSGRQQSVELLSNRIWSRVNNMHASRPFMADIPDFRYNRMFTELMR